MAWKRCADKGRTVAQACWAHPADWFGLGPIAVRPDLQGQGIGGALIPAGLNQLGVAGAKSCVVHGDPKDALHLRVSGRGRVPVHWDAGAFPGLPLTQASEQRSLELALQAARAIAARTWRMYWYYGGGRQLAPELHNVAITVIEEVCRRSSRDDIRTRLTSNATS